uniref:Multiple inositol polyphosphate phosphatase 1 n=1 Tax=Poecilia latipinna TaxID=48699 RepID=A0A3B3UM92_9TELE
MLHIGTHGFLWLAALSLIQNVEFCSSAEIPDVPSIATYFGTKTRYEEVKPNLLRDPLTVNTSVLRPPPGDFCTPFHVTAIIRHGSRFPTIKNIRRIHRLSELLQNEASRTSESSTGWLDELRNRWEPWYTEDMDGQLVRKGREDLQFLAQRLATLLPSLLSEENVRKRRIHFVTSSKHRCVSSVEAFQEGLQITCLAQGYNHEVDDELMRFFERCRGYVEGVENNHTALLEVEKFKHGEEMQIVMLERNIPFDLFFPFLALLDLVEAAFFICSYELSIKSIHSPWCFLFDESDAKVLEYSFDLKQFWKRSHGHLISSLSSCPLFHHIFRTLDKAGQPASVLVGHAETLIPLISLLGLYKDQTLPTASNYHSQHGRSFRTSRIIPYAANLLFVLYDCQRGPRLQLLINETPLRFPNFQTEDAPLYRDVRAAYRYLLDGCDFNTECERKPEGRGPNTEL